MRHNEFNILYVFLDSFFLFLKLLCGYVSILSQATTRKKKKRKKSDKKKRKIIIIIFSVCLF